jgi:hypothetical protein
MDKWLITSILFVMCIGTLGLLGCAFASHKSQADADVLEREIRGSLPIGSTVSAVEDSLKTHGLESHFDAPSKTIYAVARKLKGSTLVTRKDLALKFYFDDSSKLKAIDAKVVYTGP